MPKRPPYDPASDKPFKLSRSGLELLNDCPRCFYLDKRLGVGRPGGFPFNINSAIDTLLKREFDFHRQRAEPHPLMTEFGVEAVPFAHADLSTWRHNFTGVRHLHRPTGFLVSGAVDDVWVNPAGELIVVDYKATAKKADIRSLDEEWHGGYKRQFEVYQWLLRRNGFRVSDRAYWVYANGDTTADRFDRMVRFRMTVIPYDGDDSWVEPQVIRAKECLDADAPPPAADDCEWCGFARDAAAPTSRMKMGASPTAVPISAGTLLYRGAGESLEVLLVRAAGAAPWGIPKGAPQAGESVLLAARRETAEETGVVAPDTLSDLGSVTASRDRKTVHCFAGRVGMDVRAICASPEIDRAEFVPIRDARSRVRRYQVPLLDRLEALLAATDHTKGIQDP